jgi:hypothetical protein
MIFWQIALGVLFSLGCLMALGMGLKPPKSPNPLGLGMMFIMFVLMFMEAFTAWYRTDNNLINNGTSVDNEAKVLSVTEFICYPLLWWFVCYLFLSLAHPPHHKIHKMLLIASCINVAFILIFYGILSANNFDNLYAPLTIPAFITTALDWQRGIYWTLSMGALCMLQAKLRRG